MLAALDRSARRACPHRRWASWHNLAESSRPPRSGPSRWDTLRLVPPGPLSFAPLPSDDPLHKALAKVGELYTATNFMTWWDARAFAVDGPAAETWDPAIRDHVGILAGFVEEYVLPNYVGEAPAFNEHIAKVGMVGWDVVREGLLDALKHHPTAGGSHPSTAAGQFSPHTFMLLDILEDQVASALGLGSGRDLSNDRNLRCVRLRPREGSAFEGTLYQHLFLVWAPAKKKLIWFDLGGSQ